MGTPLTNQTPSETYIDLLKISNSNAGLTGTLKTIGCGNGTDSKIMISTTSIDVSGIVYMSGTLLSANVNELNKLHRSAVDGDVEENKVLVSDDNNGLATLGGSINFLSPGGGLANGTSSNFSLGPYGYVLNDLGETDTILLNPASGNTYKATITSTTTALSFALPEYILNDYYAAVTRAYNIKLFIVQDSIGGKSISWPSTGMAFGNLYFPSGQWTSTASRYPSISGATYNPSSGEVDIFDFWTYDFGITWLGQRVASGIKRNG